MTTKKYTRNQIELALKTLDIHADPSITEAEAVRAAGDVLAWRAQNIALTKETPEPITGFEYDPSNRSECDHVRMMILLYRLFAALRAGVPMWLHDERERTKAAAWARLRDQSLKTAERVDAAHRIMEAHYARSAWSSLSADDPLCFVWHPDPHEFFCHYLHASPGFMKELFGEETAAVLLLRYPRPAVLQIGMGKSYWGTANSNHESWR